MLLDPPTRGAADAAMETVELNVSRDTEGADFRH